MAIRSSAISGFESWPDFFRGSTLLTSTIDGAQRLGNALGVPTPPSPLPGVIREHVWTVGGVRIIRLRWQLPFGPATQAYLLTPENARGTLPAILWLHCHAGNKWLGSERMVDLGSDTTGSVLDLQRQLYDGRAVANEMARAGFAVLVHDAFSWGSRRFDLGPLPGTDPDHLSAATTEQAYNEAAATHEHTIAKAAGLLGTSYAGMVAYEDLTALAVLQNLPEVDEQRIATGGFSGGGGRALVLSALAPDIRACVVACMMATFRSLFPTHVGAHSWLLTTPGLATYFEWPELTTIPEQTRYLVQYAKADPLFPHEGMRAADTLLRRLHAEHPARYTAAWHHGGHIFDSKFLTEAIAFLTGATMPESAFYGKVC